ncbi:hypothetical protein A3K78_06565 [Candidatus Bathyarchaeota archaeon RBG_13_52_12]|nr:MAG: hypothetical protein A3K78_06565 [Candidatus Bathyarchaeota archaeon RBG_13_52_12]
MSEKRSAQELETRWPSIMGPKGTGELTGFLSANSNLPGPRSNLTLAFKVAELVQGSWREHEEWLRGRLDDWAHSVDEYLLLCRNITLGYILSAYDDEAYEEVLFMQNFHPMWRAREAVTLGLQKTLSSRTGYTLKLLERWNESGDALILRNTLMVLADPPSLRDSQQARDSLRAYIIQAMELVKHISPEAKRGDGYKLLKKSLGFVPSVAAVHDGRIVKDMENWARADVKEWKTVVRSNLGKSRLRDAYPLETERIKAALGRP